MYPNVAYFINVIKPYLGSVRWMAAVTPGSVSSCGSAHGAPPGCSAACNYGHSNCTYTASLPLERTLGTMWGDSVIFVIVKGGKTAFFGA